MKFSVLAGALIVSAAMINIADAQTADMSSAATASTAKTKASKATTERGQQTRRDRAAQARPLAEPAAEPSPFERLSNFFQGNAAQRAPADPRSRTASASGSSVSDLMTAKAHSSYSTSSNALGFGFYRITPKETVAFNEKHAPGTIIVRQREKRLYFVQSDGTAIRYAIAVGREGAAWAGTSTVSDKREWPDWRPTPSILKRQPDLPTFVEGGPHNPLGARALYLGDTLYRIHGTNEPWRIGEEASSGCIRMSNEDVIDLYNRTRLGAKVIVQR